VIPLADVGDLGLQARIIAGVGTFLFLILVIDLVRRRRLVERYALLWISAAVILVVLSLWSGALRTIAEIQRSA
jgi:multisubunit Na+/H+ antiporter MnhB subunit